MVSTTLAALNHLETIFTLEVIIRIRTRSNAHKHLYLVVYRSAYRLKSTKPI
jgi:hypothetical protein